jgi:hypothetical protein
MSIKSRLDALVKALGYGPGELWDGGGGSAYEIASHFFTKDKSDKPGIRRMGLYYAMGAVARDVAASRLAPTPQMGPWLARPRERAARDLKAIGLPSDAGEAAIADRLIEMAREERFTPAEIDALRKFLAEMFRRGGRRGRAIA